MSVSPFRFGILGAVTGVALLAANPASAASGHGSDLLPNIDVRDGQKVPHAAPAATAKLERSLGVQGFADTNPQTGGVSFVGRSDKLLTGPSKEAPTAIVTGYVRDNKAAFGLDSSDLNGLKLTESYTSIDGVTHVTYSQIVGGIESFDTYLRGNVTKDGRLINVSGSPQPDLSLNTTSPTLSADEALLAARKNVGGDDTLPPVKARGSGPQQKTTYDTYAESAWLVAFAQANGDRLAWEVQVLDKDDILYRVVVDALNGEILVRQSMTAFDNSDAQIWPYFPSQLVAPTQVNFGADPSWLDRSAANGNQLIGNNTHTYADVGGGNGYQAGEEITRNGGLAGNWKYPMSWYNQAGCPAAGCTWNSGVANSATVNRKAGAVGLFYLTNHFHDHLLNAPIGFNEASRNFEHVNATGQGIGTDAVLAEAQDSSGLNNANFATPADGTSPRMQMYLWNGTPGGAGPQYDVDGSASADVVYHEYTHGLSNRLVGNGAGLSPSQSGAMGEGWSDFYAMDLLVAEGHQGDAAGTADVWLGGYVTGVPGIFGGISRIRHQAIDCPVGAPAAQCPASGTAGSGGYTYGDLGRVGTVNGVHDGGEIWSQTMWDLRKSLGRTDALKIITGGMRLSPNGPSYLDMRDAILQSALVNGVNVNSVWKVFAGRGMGFLAATPSADTNSATEDFSMPPKVQFVSTLVNDNAPRGDGDGVAEPGETLAVTTSLRNLDAAPLDLVGTLASTAGTVTRDAGAWTAIPVGGQKVNAPAFAVTLPENQQCGVTAELTISVNGPDGPVPIPATKVVTGTPSFTEATDVPKAIPDNSAAGVNSTFTFPNPGTVQGLAVRITRVNHTWIGDLKATLSHQGTTVTLFNKIGDGTATASRDNLVNLVLDDQAVTPVVDATYNGGAGGVTGTYRPTSALSAFNGHSRAGTWTLNISDDNPIDTGSLVNWAPGVRVCDTFGLPSSQTDAASGIGMGEATLNGTHTSNGRATDYRFEWGTTTAYGEKTPVTNGGAASGGVPVSAALSGLNPGTVYHFRLISLRDGTVLSRGADQVFTTVAPTVASPPPASGSVEVKDTSAPQVTITKAPKKKITTKKPKVTVKVTFTSEAGATFTCKIDKAAAKPCTSPLKAKVRAKFGKGKKHVIVVVAKDAADNTSAPATVAFKAVRKR